MPKRFGNYAGKKPGWKKRVGEIVTLFRDPRTSTGAYAKAKLIGRRGSPLDVEGLELWTVETVPTYKYPNIAFSGLHYIGRRR